MCIRDSVNGGAPGVTIAEALAETLRQRGWNRRAWDARVVQAGVGVSGADIVIGGEIRDFSTNAKSRVFNTKLTGESRLVIKARNLADDSSTCLLYTSPTGGGKTLLACYAAGLAQRQFMRAERAVVLWLVPSNTILDQTADALRDPRHPYRRALELACGAVEVMTIDEALRLSRATIDGQTVVIVSTIQSFRGEDTTGRRVYDPVSYTHLRGHRRLNLDLRALDVR